MKRTLHPLRSTAALLTAAACAPAAGAQAQPPVGVITYAGLAAAQAVPTLTQWGVLLLSLLLAPLAWRAARGRLACLALAGPGLLAAALLLAAGWSERAQALPLAMGDVLLDNAAGGSADIPYHAALDTPFADFLYQYEVGNATGQPLRITGTTLTPGHTDRAPLDTPRCTAGLVLAPGEGCYLRVGKPH
jgi:hypothetical protein